MGFAVLLYLLQHSKEISCTRYTLQTTPCTRVTMYGSLLQGKSSEFVQLPGNTNMEKHKDLSIKKIKTVPLHTKSS